MLRRTDNALPRSIKRNGDGGQQPQRRRPRRLRVALIAGRSADRRRSCRRGARARGFGEKEANAAKFRFGVDTGVVATAYLAHTKWQLGEIERARALIDAG